MSREPLGRHSLIIGDCVEAMNALEPESVDAIVCDPPYGIGFMGSKWDALPPGLPWAKACLRVLKPGGHLVAFGGTRTVHRLTCALEDAGFEIRDALHWAYFSGFPKSLDVSKAIDRAAGAEREVVGEYARPDGGRRDFSKSSAGIWSSEGSQDRSITAPATDDARTWKGYGTALKPAVEPAILARKPLIGTVAANVLEHGTGALNIDGCRFGYGDPMWVGPNFHPSERGEAWLRSGNCRTPATHAKPMPDASGSVADRISEIGRWPANLIYCPKPSTAEREAGCEGLRQQSAGELTGGRAEGSDGLQSPRAGAGRLSGGRGNAHPTVKPIRLMRWISRLVCPPSGVILEPFAGSGTTLLAADMEGFRCVAIEREPKYAEIIRARFAGLPILRRMQQGETLDDKAKEAAMRQVSLW